MDSIDRIIEQGAHRVLCAKFAGQSWHDFEAETIGKKVVLFGAGVGLDFFYARYAGKMDVVGVVDNDANLWGLSLKSLALNVTDSKDKELTVNGIDFLDEFQSGETVVLITSLNHYVDIAAELETRNIKKIFSLLVMEISRRLQHGIKDLPDYRQKFFSDCRKLPVKQNRIILLTARDGEGHGKEISAKLLDICPDLDIIWMVRKKDAHLPQGVKAIYFKNGLDYMAALATAKVWLTDTGANVKLKRQGQIRVEMKHWSSVTLKMFGYDELEWRGEEVLPDSPVRGWDGIDYVLVGSKFDERTCRSGFRLNGSAVYVGSPRTDILFRNREEIKTNNFPQLHGKKCLLYAPTYRIVDSKQMINTHGVNLNFESTKRAMENRFGGEWVILLRLHPFVKNMSHSIKIPPYVINVSDYCDGEELVAMADAMVTDYSSIMFEPAFIKHPVFLFAMDKVDYLKKERGFLIPYDTLPFPIAESNEELDCNIENFDYDKYVRDVDAFMDKYGVHEDGHAGERAARFILDLLDGKVHKGEPRDAFDYTVVEGNDTKKHDTALREGFLCQKCQ